MLVEINEEKALKLLVERVKYWTDDEDVICLFEKMYERYVYDGCFKGCEFDVMVIVDNDYINWCSVISEGDEAYEDIKRLYDEFGLIDISCECDYSFIEAEHNGMFLIRL